LDFTQFQQHSLQFLPAAQQALFLEALQKPSVSSIRYNPFKNTDFTEVNIPWTKYGKSLDQKPVFTLDPAFHAGAYYVQEASSMFLEQFFSVIKLPTEAVVLDLCASPGGKSTHLLSLLSPSQLLISNEVIKTRTATLKENLVKWGCENSVVTNNDSQDFARLEALLDLVVIDAPCSGEGLFRKDPDALKEWSPEAVETCWKRQRRILADIDPAVKKNGYIIYSTCTYNALEDEDNVNWFAENYGYDIVPLESIPANVYQAEPGYKFLPHLGQGEGFYIACLQKKLGTEKTWHKSRNSNLAAFKAKSMASQYALDSFELDYYLFKETVKAIHPAHKIIIDMLSQHLRLLTVGLDIGELLKGKELIPAHSLALSRLVNRESFKQTKLTKEQALLFLKKELSDIPADNGLNIAIYEGYALGFFKKINNRINNQYPQEWRIRMEIS
jgi:16S rRNA C967 or C1407 C5-methylase (RsmB/RsmF family)/NOL1/NOP2/fmu family ribosome biogenesis protein